MIKININLYVGRKTYLYVLAASLVLSLGLYIFCFEPNMRAYPQEPTVSTQKSAFGNRAELWVHKPVYTSWNSQAAAGTGQTAEPAVSESFDEPVTEPVKPTSAVISKSGLTEDQIADILKGSDLAGQALEDPILHVEDEYGINAFFTIAVMKLESGHGKSVLAKEKNNLFGLNAIDGQHELALRFRTKGDCVREFGDIISRIYLEKGLTTVERVAKKYCPANTKWPALVNNIMQRDYQKSVL